MTTVRPVIITIDDDQDFNNLLAKRLNSLNITTHTAQTPEEFFSLLKTVTPDLCFIDMNIGNLYGAGYQIIQTIIKKLEPQYPLIALSKRSSREDINKALRLGASDYITKPLDMVILEAKIRQYITLDTPFYSVPYVNVEKQDQPFEFKLTLKIKAIKERGVTIQAPFFISEKSSFYLTGEIVYRITKRTTPLLVTVSECKKALFNEDLYIIDTLFDSYDSALLESVRDWLVKNS